MMTAIQPSHFCTCPIPNVRGTLPQLYYSHVNYLVTLPVQCTTLTSTPCARLVTILMDLYLSVVTCPVILQLKQTIHNF